MIFTRAFCRSRYAVIPVVVVVYAVLSMALRIGLMVYEGNSELLSPLNSAEILLIGLLYDLAAVSWMLIPFMLNAMVWPASDRGRRLHAWSTSILLAAGLGAVLFGLVAEVLFWNEFSARFNFIAVDYLVYTREVVGNIEQSYPLAWIFTGLAVASVVLILIVVPPTWRLAGREAPNWKRRGLITIGYACVPAACFFLVTEAPHQMLASPVERELASNGPYSLFRAFRNNDLSYDRFYATLPEADIKDVLEGELNEAKLGGSSEAGANGFAHKVVPSAPQVKKNVILVSIESLGSDYVESFGGREGLTPNLTALTKDSLTFHNLYATGLRTVRGLEAITLSVPPTPGRAVPIRERNKGMMSLGSVLKEHGYDAMYLYGGYSFFDNQKDFFSGAGYEVLDRTDISSDTIDHETIWGVSDEDLFDFALTEFDDRAQKGTPFFGHIMTTSNHRPYTYPEGRIDIPSKTGRDGAVKYTDWAIGDFLKKARTRPWFSNTVFVFLADHTSHGRGRIDLPPENYRIPMWIYSPGFIAPRQIDWVASQIDVAPTLLGLLNVPYDSSFFGQDILVSGQSHQRAFMANYLTVGYMEGGMVVSLGPNQRVRVQRVDDGTAVDFSDPKAKDLIREAISYYQSASEEIERVTQQ
ncbi:MAG: LTA synthase family protein [Alphaproteobacteria bacterium]|nr:LTA synthase family protein [Alphaproteobacteria bacterium]